MKILISGVLGFCGRAIASALQKKNHKIYGITRRPINNKELSVLPNNVVVISLDLSDASKVDTLIPKDIDCIIHAAGCLKNSNKDVAELVKNNIVASYNLINYANKNSIPKFINFSSLSIHGSLSSAVVDEKTPISNPHPYGYTKRASELLLAQFDGVIGSLSIRLPGIIGDDCSLNWFSRVAQQLSKNEKVIIFNPNHAYNNLIHIQDLVEYCAQLVEIPFQKSAAFPIAAKNYTTVAKAIERLRKNLKSHSKIQIISSESNSFTIDTRLASEKYNFNPMTINQTIDLFSNDFHDSIQPKSGSC
jgi:nucleoside-diphosphate-sugar epimerase